MLPGMKPKINSAITLIELIISIVLLGMVMMGFYGIDMFSRNQFIGIDRKAKVENDAVFVLAHISKNLLRAIGDVDPANAALNISPGANTGRIIAKIDSNGDGMRDGSDADIGYCFNLSGCNNTPVRNYAIVFNSNLSATPQPAAETIATHVRSFNAVQNGNFLNVTISTCWNPTGSPRPCGTLDNPAFNSTSIIRMPSVSAK